MPRIASASVFQDLTWAELSTAMQRFWAQVSYAELLGFKSQSYSSGVMISRDLNHSSPSSVK